jgi:hypothetical protein
LNPSEYNKTLNFYGRLKLCLQADVSFSLNRSKGFKCPDETGTANHAEGLIPFASSYNKIFNVKKWHYSTPLQSQQKDYLDMTS